MSSTPPVAETAAGTTHTGDPADEPLGGLVHRLSEQIPDLVRSELRLAQAELTEKGKSAGVGIGMFGAAGLTALFGVAALLATLVIVLDLAMPLWVAALIVTVVLFAAAGVIGVLGKREVTQATPPKPERAIEGIKEDIATVTGGSS